MLTVNGYTKLLAVIGDPIGHTLSPQLHNYISEKMGNNYVYTALRVEPKNIPEAIAGMRALGIAGINATVPHKYAVMDYIDKIDEQALRLGSVNTIVNRGGVLYGYNTDADGFYRAAQHDGITFEGKDILILGAGGAAKPLCVFLSEKDVRSITVCNRTAAKARELAAYVKKTNGFDVSCEMDRPRYDVVINATSAGMEPNIDTCALTDFSVIDQNTAAIDIVYKPAKTLFLRKAEEKGAKIQNGLGMLINQGIIAYEYFTDTKVSEETAEELMRMLGE